MNKVLISLALPFLVLWIGGWLLHIVPSHPESFWPVGPLFITVVFLLGSTMWYAIKTWDYYKDEQEQQKKLKKMGRRAHCSIW